MKHKKHEEDYSLRIEGDYNCLIVNSDHANLSEEIGSSEKPGEYTKTRYWKKPEQEQGGISKTSLMAEILIRLQDLEEKMTQLEAKLNKGNK